MIKHDFPENSFIGGWYIPENACDGIIDFYNDYRNRVKHVTNEKLDGGGDHAIKPGVYLARGSLGANKRIELNDKDSYDLGIEVDCETWNKDKRIRYWAENLQKCLMNYIKIYPDCDKLTPFSIHVPVNIQHYLPGGGFKIWHFESSSPFTMPRKLVFMTYLNDVPNGGTEFKYQGIKSPAKKGLTIIWPSDWMHTHRGIIDEENEKYIITGWYNLNIDKNVRFPWL